MRVYMVAARKMKRGSFMAHRMSSCLLSVKREVPEPRISAWEIARLR